MSEQDDERPMLSHNYDDVSRQEGSGVRDALRFLQDRATVDAEPLEKPVGDGLLKRAPGLANDSLQLAAVRAHGRSALEKVGIKAGLDGVAFDDPEPDQAITALANYALQCRDGHGGEEIRQQIMNWVLQLRVHPSLKGWTDGDAIPEEIQNMAPEAGLQAIAQGFAAHRGAALKQREVLAKLDSDLNDAKAAKVGYASLLASAVADIDREKRANHALSTQVEVALGMLAQACCQPSMVAERRIGVLVGHLVQQRDDAAQKLLAFAQVIYDVATQHTRDEHHGVWLAFDEMQKVGVKPYTYELGPEQVMDVIEQVRVRAGTRLSKPVERTIKNAHAFKRAEDDLRQFGVWLGAQKKSLCAMLGIDGDDGGFTSAVFADLDTYGLARSMISRFLGMEPTYRFVPRDEYAKAMKASTYLGSSEHLLNTTLEAHEGYFMAHDLLRTGDPHVDTVTVLQHAMKFHYHPLELNELTEGKPE